MTKRKRPKVIQYNITLICHIDQYQNVIPTGSHDYITPYTTEDPRSEDALNMIEYPSMEELMTIWIGKCYSYPKTKYQTKKARKK